MVAIVSGNSLGLSLTSLATLGQRGILGQATEGGNGEPGGCQGSPSTSGGGAFWSGTRSIISG